MPLSLIELMTSPERFDRKLVAVQGFLRIEQEEKHGVKAFLYLDEDAAKDLLTPNQILLIPSKQMLRDREKIDRMYVAVTASFRAVPAANGAYIPVLKDIQSCTVRPRPEHTD
jgi:hypothetical protein